MCFDISLLLGNKPLFVQLSTNKFGRFDRTDFLGRFTTCERQGDKKDQRKGKAYLIHS